MCFCVWQKIPRIPSKDDDEDFFPQIQKEEVSESSCWVYAKR